MSSAVLLLSAIITDAVAGSKYQSQLILGFRYFAFFLVIIDVSMQACAKEFPYPEGPRIRLVQVFTLPFKYRKFLYCLLLMFFWNYIGNLNNGLWSYHLLNHMEFSYTLINTMSVMVYHNIDCNHAALEEGAGALFVDKDVRHSQPHLGAYRVPALSS